MCWNELHCAAQSFVKDVEDLGLHDSTTDRCRVSAKTGLPDDIKMPAWLKAYQQGDPFLRKHHTGLWQGRAASHALYGSKQSIANVIPNCRASCNAPEARPCKTHAGRGTVVLCACECSL